MGFIPSLSSNDIYFICNKEVERMEKDDLRYYRFLYLIKVNGGVSLFGPKRDKYLYISFILTAAVAFLFYYKKIGYHTIYNFTNISAVASATLFGLIIASFAIVTSINEKKLLTPMIVSGYYAYAIFSFTWAAIWALISVLVDVVSLVLSIQTQLFMIAVFSIIYTVFTAFSLIYFSLRHIAIMNVRYDHDLQSAWDTFEEKSEKEDL